MMPTQIEDKRIEQTRETYEFFYSLNEELGDKISNFFSEEQEHDLTLQSVKTLIDILEMMKRLASRDPITQFSIQKINELVSRWLPRLKNAKRLHEEFETQSENEENNENNGENGESKRMRMSSTSNLAIIFTYTKELIYSAIISATTHIVTIDSQIQATRMLQPSYYPFQKKSRGLRGLLSRIWYGGDEDE